MLQRAFYLDSEKARCFCLYYAPEGKVHRGAILYLPPFFEEMNCLRRHAADMARLFSSVGFSVLQIDYSGTGDSSGNLLSAGFSQWITELKEGLAFLQQNCTEAVPVWLWAVRGSCLMLPELVANSGQTFNYLLWQPVTHGEVFLRQFLRVKVVRDALLGHPKTSIDALLNRLRQGELVEVAGYPLGAQLAEDLLLAKMTSPERIGQLLVFEKQQLGTTDLAPGTQAIFENWRQFSSCYKPLAVDCGSFWQHLEVVDTQKLKSASLACLQSSCYEL